MSARELLSSAGLRSDGRRWGELRSVVVQCGVLPASTGADGSCSYQQGNTIVLAAVFGPREQQAGGMVAGSTDSASEGVARVTVQVKQAAFAGSARREQRRSDKRLAEMSLVVRQSVAPNILAHTMPGSHISIGLTVLHDDGGLLPASLNAATLALMHAGIPLRDVPVAVAIACAPHTANASSQQQHQQQPSVSRPQTAHADSAASSAPSAQSVVLVDPSVSEASSVAGQSGCLLQFGFGCCSDRIVFNLSSGRLPVAELDAMLTASKAACHAIHQRMKDEMSRCSQTRNPIQR